MPRANRYTNKLISKYSLDGFVELKQNDVVFDVGARTGTYTFFAASKVDRIIGIEPEPANLKLLEFNATEQPNIEVSPCAAWEADESVLLNVTKSRSGHSVLDLDLRHRGGIVDQIEVSAKRIDTIAHGFGITEIDLLKIDAEGAELEVLKGTTDVKVRKIAVDCAQGAKSSGDWTTEEVKRYLNAHSYEVRIDPNHEAHVFARLDSR
jgi:FkbM family methyltransferase